MTKPFVERILIRCPNWVGDAVMATPFIEAVRREYPDAHIELMLKKYVGPVYEGAPWMNGCIEIPPVRKKTFVDRIQQFFANVRAIRAGRFDMAVLLSNTFQCALEAALAGVPFRIGYLRDARGWLLTRGPRPLRSDGAYTPESMIDYYNRLGGCIGIERSISRKMKLFTTDDEEREALSFLKNMRVDPSLNIVGLNPGAAFGGSKFWPAEYFARVGDHFAARKNTAVVVFSGPGEAEIAGSIASLMKQPCHISPDTVLSLGGLKAMVRRCALLVTNDTGPRHFASAFDVPSVVIIGPTDARWTHNDDPHQAVLQKTPVCGPCHLRACPYNHQCMKMIKPDDVIAASEKLLEKTNQAEDLVYGRT